MSADTRPTGDGRLGPIIEWIGNIPIEHGERSDSEACLCGHEWYMTCPEWLNGGGIAGMTFYAADGGVS